MTKRLALTDLVGLVGFGNSVLRVNAKRLKFCTMIIRPEYMPIC